MSTTASQPYGPQPPPPTPQAFGGPPPPPRKQRRWPWIVGIIVALFVGVGIGSAGGDDTKTTDAGTPLPAGASTSPASPSEAATTEEPVVEDPVPEYDTPGKKDFALSVKTLSKDCFGSAGCNVTFRVKLAYGGLLGLDPDKTYDVTYEIRGGEDPKIGTIEATGDSYTVPSEDIMGTTSSGAQLRAVVTDVEEQ